MPLKKAVPLVRSNFPLPGGNQSTLFFPISSGPVLVPVTPPPPPEITNAIIVGEDEYLSVGENEYLMFVDPN